ncbi:MAG: hypothetical protein GY777_05025 [Candidatus Brocadiaceae bacterium]|nr:hypothetical protein [Candidatus Brocadiaceae bacterium]
MISIKDPNCHKRKCVHYMWMKGFVEEEEVFARHICTAFPDGIPDIISYGDEKHLKPLKNQGNNIVYKEAEE